jgi:hypothetical protein
MSLHTLLHFLAAAIMLAFSVAVWQRYATRRTPAFLFWAAGLTMFAVASFAGAYLSLAWSPVLFFLWYFCGAVLTAAWIGHGTLCLLVRKRWLHGVTAVLVIGSLLALILMLRTMPLLDTAHFTLGEPISEQYREIMPATRDGGTIRLTTPFFNIYGLLTIVGGALYSTFLYWRKRVLPNRVVGNLLIAGGAILIAMASTLTRLGFGSFLYVGELMAAVMMFSGFLAAAAPQPVADNNEVVAEAV